VLNPPWTLTQPSLCSQVSASVAPSATLSKLAGGRRFRAHQPPHQHPHLEALDFPHPSHLVPSRMETRGECLLPRKVPAPRGRRRTRSVGSGSNGQRALAAMPVHAMHLGLAGCCGIFNPWLPRRPLACWADLDPFQGTTRTLSCSSVPFLQ
jgi:hypothetical protein